MSPICDDDYDDDDATISERATPKIEPRKNVKMDSSAKPPSSDNRQKGPCSYELCPNPTHSSGGGFKVVSHETKAGSRDWSMYSGRVFCNACFTQFATRGTLQRPGRLLTNPTTAAQDNHGASTTAAQYHQPEPAFNVVHKSNKSHYLSAPAPPRPVRIATKVKVDEDVVDDDNAVLVLELECTGPNLQYQWLRDGRPIYGAVDKALVIENPRQVFCEITCKVSNQYGATTPFAPVKFPLSVTEANQRFTKPSILDLPAAITLKLTCVCGVSRTGTSNELMAPCSCGLEVCGNVVPMYTKEEKIRVDKIRSQLDMDYYSME